MQTCKNCGTENDDAALYCKHCGVSFKTGVSAPASTVDQRMKGFAQDMDQLGKRVGDRVSQAAQRVADRTSKAGRRFEQRTDHISRSAQSRYDRTFGIIGPLVSSFIFLIIMRIVVELLQLSPDNVRVFQILGASLYTYLLILFGVTLLSNYTQYFARRSLQFRVFSPILIAVVPVVWLWVAMQVLITLSDPLKLPELKTAASTINSILPTVFIFVLLIGYVVFALDLSREQRRQP
ncbi:MAG TPA: zinc ribbon domain-containing protein [Candidatus Thermoplasmatota archaeon]|nr:zinc ribbon domain-containing protein [Candidatus Thermoplasmatota archaeon]